MSRTNRTGADDAGNPSSDDVAAQAAQGITALEHWLTTPAAVPVHAGPAAAFRREYQVVSGIAALEEWLAEGDVKQRRLREAAADRRAATLRWRRLSEAGRDGVILDALDGGTLAMWPLLKEIWAQREDLKVTDAGLRKHVKSMTARGLLDENVERPAYGRSRKCWCAR